MSAISLEPVMTPKAASVSTQVACAFAPASVGNVGVGFDLLGHSVTGAGDRAQVRRIAEPVVRIATIRGCVSELPLEPSRNTAGAALLSLRHALGLDHGFELVLHKGIALGSGMGGSAASCVAALVAANALLPQPQAREALYPFALDGEAVASGSRHGDNIGPMLLGGLVLATRERLVRIPVPDAWHCALVHPHAVLETRRARAVLDGGYALREFVAQSANLALVLMGCERGDADLVRAGLSDVLVEPRRAALIANFARVKQAALDSHALGASISGAGPSVFGWYANHADASAAALAMRAAFAEAGLTSDAWVSPINGPAAGLIRSLDEALP
ncbi:MAG: homoserine kinase [Xanthomonadales bacterium]|nr:homoserine kinase [Xanthomonadales bacterium]